MILHESPYGPVHVRDISITQAVFEGLKGRPDDAALIDGPTGRTVTRAQLVGAIKSLAGGLTAQGLAPGKCIALMAPNIPEYAVVFHGVAWAGGTITTVNPTYTAAEVRHQLNDSGAEVLITIGMFLETAKEAIKGTKVSKIVVIGEAAEGAVPLSSLMGAPLEAQAKVDLDEHILVLPYSSGTTGLPKGVMLTHRNLVANVDQCLGCLEIEGVESTPAFLPFFHIYGMTVLLNLYLCTGGVLITMPRFDLEQMLKLTQAHKCERLWIVPPIAIALAKHPMIDQFDLSSVVQINSGAAPMGAELTRAVAQRLKTTVTQGYGMTELSPVSHITQVKACKDGAAGRTAPGTVCRVVGEDGKDLGPNQEGELWVKGPQVMKGYLNNAKATEATIVEDGWLRTGDVAMFDDDGYLYIRDRVKELIKVKGFQVAPAEVEAALLTHPKVADVAVIGIPDDESGEIPMAFVQPGAAGTPTLEELQAHLAGQLSKYKVIQRMQLVEAVPKSASGKILRRLLRDKVAA